MIRATRAGALLALVLAASAVAAPAVAQTPANTFAIISSVTRAAGADPATSVLDASIQAYAFDAPEGLTLRATRPTGQATWDKDFRTNVILYGPGWVQDPAAGDWGWVSDRVEMDPAIADAWFTDELAGPWEIAWGERTFTVDGAIGFVPTADRRYPELDAASEAAFLAARGNAEVGSLSLSLAASAGSTGAFLVDLIILDEIGGWSEYVTLRSGTDFEPIVLETPIPADAVLLLTARSEVPTAHGPDTVLHRTHATTIYGLPEVAP